MKIQTNEKLIQFFLDKKIIKTLAFFYRVKVLYNNSVVYNYSPEKLAKATNITESKVKKHVRTLKKLGIVIRQKTRTKGKFNLWFISIKTIMSKLFKMAFNHFKKCTIKIRKNSKLLPIVDALILKLIQKIGIRQALEVKFRIKKQELERKNNILKNRSSLKYLDLSTLQRGRVKREDFNTRFISNEDKFNFLEYDLFEFFDNMFLIGYSTLAGYLGVSKSYIWNVSKRLKEKNKIFTQKKCKFLCKSSLYSLSEVKKLGFPAYIYEDKHGDIHAAVGTAFQFADYPVRFYNTNSKRMVKSLPYFNL
jgi:biotin operon repressor